MDSYSDITTPNAKLDILYKDAFFTLKTRQQEIYKVATGEVEGTEFEFLDLCQDNGVRHLQDYLSLFSNCKNPGKVQLTVMERKGQQGLWSPKKRIIAAIMNCTHQNACTFNAGPYTDTDKIELEYETGLNKLWGDKVLSILRELVKKVKIKQQNLKTMSRYMDVSNVYEGNIYNSDTSETLEMMLEKWYEQELFRKSPSEAQAALLNVIKKSRCEPIVEEAIKESMH